MGSAAKTSQLPLLRAEGSKKCTFNHSLPETDILRGAFWSTVNIVRKTPRLDEPQCFSKVQFATLMPVNRENLGH